MHDSFYRVYHNRSQLSFLLRSREASWTGGLLGLCEWIALDKDFAILYSVSYLLIHGSATDFDLVCLVIDILVAHEAGRPGVSTSSSVVNSVRSHGRPHSRVDFGSEVRGRGLAVTTDL